MLDPDLVAARQAAEQAAARLRGEGCASSPAIEYACAYWIGRHQVPDAAAIREMAYMLSVLPHPWKVHDA